MSGRPRRAGANATDGGDAFFSVYSPRPCYCNGRPGQAAAEIKLGKDFLGGIVEKLPPTTFDKTDKYRGTVHSYRLVAIDPRTRVFLIACQIEGEFRPPVTGPISERVGRSPQTPPGWRKFRFDVKARVNIEPGVDGAPRFRIEIDEVKKRELDGFSGVLANSWANTSMKLVTQIANGRASRLNKRLNDEILKRVGVFKEYGVFQRIDYAPSEVVLHFDLTRFRGRGHRRPCFRGPAAGNRPPSIAGSIPRTALITTPRFQRPRSSELGERGDLLAYLRASRRPNCAALLLRTGAMTFSRSQTLVKSRRDWAIGRTASPVISTAIHCRGPYPLSLLRPGTPSTFLHTPSQCRVCQIERARFDSMYARSYYACAIACNASITRATSRRSCNRHIRA